MPNDSQFDGQNPVPGYTLFHGKDGKSYYLKGENLSDAEMTQRVATLRGSSSAPTIPGAPDGLPGVPKPPNPILGENIVERHRMIPGPGGGFPQDYKMTEAQAEQGQNAVKATLGTAATGAGLATAPVTTAGALIGSMAGGKGARAGAKSLGAGETVQDIAEGAGNLAGGVTGGIAGDLASDGLTNFIRNAVANIARDEKGNILSPTEILWAPAKKMLNAVVPMTEQQQATQAATKFAANAKPIEGPSVSIKESPNFDPGQYKAGILSRTTTPFGPVGSTTQEAGWSPSVTKVPIRETPFDSPLTPQSVPGPDTSGRGNLLSPLAKRGDPRAAAELQRRGRTVIYVPDSDTTMYMDSSVFADLLRKLQEE